MPRIYLDHHATTPLDPRVLAAMMPYLTERFGNAASSAHAYGWEADEAVEQARAAVAAVIGATAQEIIWTSGATESINLAIKGVADAYQSKGRHLVTLASEHPATLDTCRELERQGYEVTYLPVDATGRVGAEAVAAALRPDTLLVSVLHGNNEIGTLQPLAEIGAAAKAQGVLFHVDAAQAFGKVPLDVQAMGIDLLSLSGHKVYGPKGVGALYVRRRHPRVTLTPQIHGGGHERGLRSGTLNVPGVVGLGAAASLAASEMSEEAVRVAGLRDRLQAALLGALDGVTLNGHPSERLPGNLNLSFDFVEADTLIPALQGVAVSSGSACSSASLTASHVLLACGLPEDRAHTAVRFGLGRFTTQDEIDAVAELTLTAVRRLRAQSPRYQLWLAGTPLADQ